MIQREFTKDKIEIPQLGFGAMRLPEKKVDGKNVIDEEKATEMIEYAVANGILYFDTAYFYHGHTSEAFLGKAIHKYRDKILLADKLPMYKLENENSFNEIFEGQLERLNTDYIDFYLLHGPGIRDFENMKNFDIINKAEQLRKEGKIRYFGFSCHENYEDFCTILNMHDKFDFCQIQHNYVDINFQATSKGLEMAHQKGLSVIIMEPLRGGVLCNPPDEVKKILNDADPQRSLADWGLSFLYDKKEVSLVLSGMSTLEQLKENIEIASKRGIGNLDDNKREALKQAYDAYQKRIKVPCTDCKYCMPCPFGVDIPHNFNILNRDYKLNTISPWDVYREEHRPKSAINCVACKACEAKCPQKIAISKELTQMAKDYNISWSE